MVIINSAIGTIDNLTDGNMFLLFNSLMVFYFDCKVKAFSRIIRLNPNIKGNRWCQLPFIISHESSHFYLSARIGLFKKSSYANLMPSSSSVLYRHPKASALLTSRSLRGVPLGLLVSHLISPS